jgi:hypothetical protein
MLYKGFEAVSFQFNSIIGFPSRKSYSNGLQYEAKSTSLDNETRTTLEKEVLQSCKCTDNVTTNKLNTVNISQCNSRDNTLQIHMGSFGISVPVFWLRGNSLPTAKKEHRRKMPNHVAYVTICDLPYGNLKYGFVEQGQQT